MVPCISNGSRVVTLTSLYLVYSMDLKVSSFNILVKYADDTSLLVPQYSSVSLEDEYQNLLHWSTVNKLKINTDKTKEIVFIRPGARNFISPVSLSDTVSGKKRPP